jgi:hypothetical protein
VCVCAVNLVASLKIFRCVQKCSLLGSCDQTTNLTTYVSHSDGLYFILSRVSVWEWSTNVIQITADSRLILFLVRLAFHLKYIPGSIPVTASWLPTSRLVPSCSVFLLWSLFLKIYVTSWSRILAKRPTMLKVTPVSLFWIFTGFNK